MIHADRVRQQGKVTDLIVAKKLVNIKKSAQSRGLHFDMSLKRIRQLLNTKKCALTGMRIYVYNDVPDHVKTTTPDDCLSFDRFDSSKGYVDDNVIAVSHMINLKKSNLSPQEIINLSKGVIKVQKRLAKRKKNEQETVRSKSKL